MNEVAKTPCMPKVSIGVPVYNGESTLRRALESILSQTFTNFEVIISDNASTDFSSEICKEFAAKDQRVRYIRQDKNIGAYNNFIFTLNVAKGEYFMWAAADDYRSSDCLSFYLEAIGKAGGVFSSYASVDIESGRLDCPPIPALSCHQSRSSAIAAFLANHRPSLFYGLFKTSAAKSCMTNRPFDWSDSCFIIRIIKEYGFNTVVEKTPRYFAGYKSKYTAKPHGGRYIKLMPYFRNTFPIVIQCGPIAWFYFINVFRVSMQINLAIASSTFFSYITRTKRPH